MKDFLPHRFVACIILFRILNALFVTTYFNPDEYWQSLEVAHKLVFGYGYLTWEWSPDVALRGYFHPAIFALYYKLLLVLNIDTRWMVAYGPRVLQGICAAFTDCAVYRIASRVFDTQTARFALAAHLLCWFNAYCLIRTFSNCMETLFSTVAISYWPSLVYYSSGTNSIPRNYYKRIAISLSFAALAIITRPTNVILWIFLGLSEVRRLSLRSAVSLVMKIVLPITIVSIVVMTVVDRWGYNRWTFVPWNFIQFNALQGKSNLYGTHPWHWYITAGLPAITGTLLPLFLFGTFKSREAEKLLLHLLVWTVGVYSASSGHKEFRFLLPVLPIAMVYAGKGINEARRCLSKKVVVFFTTVIVISNIGATAYLSRWHQSAPVAVMDFLATEETDVRRIDFLLPCHGTPFYSHLHQRSVSMWFPDCSPAGRESKLGSESSQLQNSPLEFITRRYKTNAVPTHLVFFSTMTKPLTLFLKQHHFTLVKSFFHAHVSGDAEDPTANSEIVVYKSRIIIA